MLELPSLRRVRTLAASCLLALAAANPARADESSERLRQLEAQLARSMQLIERLNARVNELERAARPASLPANPPAAAASAPAWGDQARAIGALQESVNQLTDSMNRAPPDTGTPLHGFVDVGAGWSSRDDPTRQRGFHAGSLDIYLTPQIGSRIKSLMELVFEFDEAGGSFDMERVQIGYLLSDGLTLWGGRFHTPFGLWNTSFHHGANLQTSITRPHLVDFEDEGGLIPAHSVGLWADGRLALDSGKLHYDIYLANGPSVRGRRLDPNTFTDDGQGKLLGGSLAYAPEGAWNGLMLGVHAFGATVGEYNSGNVLRARTRLRVMGGFLNYDARDWEVFGEYYRFRNDDLAGGSPRTSNAGFLQVGRTWDAWTPYLRWERASLDPLDGYFRSQRSGRSFTHAVLGARYALDANASLKFELRRSREAAASQFDEGGALVDVDAVSYRRAQVQYSIAF